MRIGIAADHGGYELKSRLMKDLVRPAWEMVDFGAYELDSLDDYPDFVVSLGKALSKGEVHRGLAICGSGVGASIAANKIRNVRAALITDCYSARQGVEDDDMNLVCLGGRVIGYELAIDLAIVFLSATFKGAERFRRRLEKVAALECG
ncbi:MAG: RpiB/LacA/LacB family sugar-phosphate isomerase [Desulfobacteraceae bacterium]|nr:MAG: RpiB/LacA/LacB family sugar-phosphate isomerase [Desulfobacteraceae bacterium]